MFEKVLIANRGEIAVRIMAACLELDIKTVAVYSEADEDAGHVRYANEAYRVGPARAAESYLDQEAILQAANEASADAIHPGYGFLAENAEFARRVEKTEELTWIGPSADAMERLGEKTQARQAMAAADVPIVPGTREPVDDPEEVKTFGEEHGFPVAIKAEGGGGGRGMKVVQSPDEAADHLESAQREGEAYFDNDSVYLERYLKAPKHIEVQVLVDHHGNARHLGERECSLQRRHQKIIEEGPSPSLDENLREEITEAARRGVEAAGYTNAGTVEFLFDGEEFYFLEVNTRIQVEHTVTEEITGIDIVKWQIRIAAGEELDFAQADVELDGHAIEYRINAENPAADFEPATGTISQYDPPGRIGVRMDDAIRQGDKIGGDYDSMIGKLIVAAGSREECLARSRRALVEFDVRGIHTVIPFHKLMLDDEAFVSGSYTTDYLDKKFDTTPLADAVERWGTAGPAEDEVPERAMTVTIDGKQFDVTLGKGSASGSASGPDTVTATDATSGEQSKNRERNTVQSGGGSVDPDNDTIVTAGMDGTIISLAVAAGDKIEAGTEICVLESMKMENSVTAARDGTVAETLVDVGESIEARDPLVRFED